MRAPAAPLLLALLLLPTVCLGLQYVHDELLWTKSQWQQYKLPFPWAKLKTRDPESTRQLQGPLQAFPVNSMNGPVMDGDDIAKMIEDDARRGPALQQSSLELSLLDDEASQEAAAGVAQCKVCATLAKELWAGLTQWVDSKQQVPNKERIAAYAHELCEYEVPNEVLREWVLLRARVQQGKGLPFVNDAQAHELYMLSQRVKQHASPQEIEAVRLACRKLLKEEATAADGAGGEKPEVLHLASTLLHKYYQHLVQRLHKDGSSGGSASSIDEIVEAVDDGPVAQRQCFNRHPQCDAWRKKGECESNPKYMLGDEGKNNGWCRPACGKCGALAESDAHLSLEGEDEAHMRPLRADLLAVFQSKACVVAAPCQWAAGAGMQQLLAKARQGADKEATVLMERAEFISGPILTPSQEMGAAIDPATLRETKPMLQRGLKDALVPDKHKGKHSIYPPENFSSAAAIRLWQHLGATCTYVTTGWWMYELCYMRHINQFHMTDKHEIDWVISLGTYQSANWTVANTSASGLYPHHTTVPYVSQQYTGGNDCELDAGSGGKKRAIKRRSELRVMCSPDQDQHIIIAEVEQCIYTVELYMPQLCGMEGFQVDVPPEAAAAAAAAAARSSSGSVRRSRSSGRSGGADLQLQQAADNGDVDEYYDFPDEGEDDGDAGDKEEDPYVDPDDLLDDEL